MPGRLAKFSFGFSTALGTRLLLYISVLAWAQMRRPYPGDPTHEAVSGAPSSVMAALALADIAELKTSATSTPYGTRQLFTFWMRAKTSTSPVTTSVIDRSNRR
jgi:hypothetical protein